MILILMHATRSNNSNVSNIAIQYIHLIKLIKKKESKERLICFKYPILLRIPHIKMTEGSIIH